jgi:putative ABC transport system substrate-binding protein
MQLRPSNWVCRQMRFNYLRRRDLIKLLGGGAAAWPFTASAQQSNRAHRIGVLMGIADSDPEANLRAEALRKGLHELGWTENLNIHLDFRWTAGDIDQARLFANEIVALKPDVIVVHSTPAVNALRKLTSTIPMVFVLIGDPIGSGFIATLAHPGGQLTGFMNVDAPMAGKWLELLKEIAPKVGRVALIFNPRTSPYRSYLESFESSAPTFQVQAVATPVLDAAEIERAITALGQEPDSGLFVVPDVFVQVHRELIIRLATPISLARDLPLSFLRYQWRPDVVWARYCRGISSSSILCRSHPKGRNASRPPSPGSDDVPVGR